MNKIRRNMQGRAVLRLLLLCWSFALNAQELSYDGKRWFEVELSVFTNEYPAGEYSERPIAKNLSLQYLPKLQKLFTPISSLMIDFPEPAASAVLAPPETANAIPEAEVPSLIGPVYSPALPDGFKVNDYARDAFIALADRMARFNSINRDIGDSSEHRVLWHQVWRQPLQPRAQTPAIFVFAGEYVGNHAELEGSLRLSDISGNATLDINLWLNKFGIPAGSVEAEWKVPDFPLPLEETEVSILPPAADSRTITEVWQMQQTEILAANQLYYFDHAAFGILIQLRPYLLPEQPVVTDEGDF